MRYRRIKRLRIASAAALLLLLAGAPLLLGWVWPANSAGADAPGVAYAFAAGINSLGGAWLAALALALIFGLWLMAGQRRLVNLKYLGQNARNRHNLVETLRTLATIFGGAGLIVGSLAGLYGAMIAVRPDLAYGAPLPFLTFDLALVCFLASGIIYAAGRLGRY
jgi:hypothetical protein